MMPSAARVRASGGTSLRRGDGALRYVVHEHDDGALRFVLRLELDGALLSWTIADGPGARPGERRAAQRGADRPLRDADFEGTVQRGDASERVLVWDRGAWHPEGEPHSALSRGDLAFELSGEKLAGRFRLRRAAQGGAAWQLVRASEPASDEPLDVVSERPESVLSGRTIDEVDQPSRAETAAPEPEPVEDMVGIMAQLAPGFPLTDLDRVVFAEQGLRKGALLAYYLSVASLMLPHARARPLAWLRCPHGISARCIWQRSAPKRAPSAIVRTELRQRGRARVLGSVSDLSGILALVQDDAVELHAWGCHVDDLQRPDRLTFGLSPSTDLPFKAAIEAACAVREELAAADLESFVQTDGLGGLEVVAPLARGLTWEEHAALARHFLKAIIRRQPRRWVSAGSLPRQRLRITSRADRPGETSVLPYSLRKTPRASVATPLRWDELMGELDGESFDVRSVLLRLEAQKVDPWRGFFELQQACPSQLVRAATEGDR